MKPKDVLPVVLASLGLAMLPVGVLLYLIGRAKGLLHLDLPAMGLASLDPGALLSRLAAEVGDLFPIQGVGQFLDSSSRADGTGHAAGVAAGTGAAGAGSAPIGLGNDPFSRGVKDSAKDKLPGFIYDGLFGSEPRPQPSH